jgi:hypothetical protein
MRNHNRHYTSNLPSLTVFPTRTTAPTLAVYLLHHLLHLLVSVAHQPKRLPSRVLCLPTVSALPAHHRKCVLSSRTERDLLGTATRDHTNTMPILLPRAALLVELLRQHLPKLLLSKQLASATTDRRLHHQSSECANGRTTLTT